MEKITFGHVFSPALSDISLKRFRLRYNTLDDVYYLHWDNTVCAALSKHEGVATCLYSSCKLRRHEDQAEGMAYLSPEAGALGAHVEWCVDFASSGLVVSNAKIRMMSSSQSHDQKGSGNRDSCSSDMDDKLSMLVHGDNRPWSTYDLIGDYVELDDLYGSSRVSIMLAYTAPTSHHGDQVKLLSCAEGDACPLDLIVELMCPRPKGGVYCGEILLGIKFEPEKLELSDNWASNGCSLSSSEASPEEQVKGGELHVHVIEGAGLISEETHKPYKTVVKCEIVPDLYGKFPVKQTTPKHNAYPTWTENLIFTGVTRDHLSRGALEVILCDYHHFSSNQTIGGLRLCVPIKKDHHHFVYSLSSLPPPSPCHAHLSESLSPSVPDTCSATSSRSVSPLSNVSRNSGTEGLLQPSTLQLYTSEIRNKSRSLPRLSLEPTSSAGKVSSPSLQSPILQLQAHHRVASIPNVNSCENAFVPTGRRDQEHRSSSPIAIAKHLFNLSNLKNSLSPFGSPKSSPKYSPLLCRRRFRGGRHQGNHEERESDYLYWWMEEVREGERRHWKQVLDNEGKWSYCWHSIHYRLQPAYS